MNDNSYNVLPEFVDSLDELEEWMDNYQLMSHDRKKLSNDMSIEKYGLNNIDRYDILKGILSSNIDPEDGTNNIDNTDFKQTAPLTEDGSTEVEVVDPDEERWGKISEDIRRAESQGLVIVCSPYNMYLGDYGPEDGGYEIKMRWNKFLALSSDLRTLSNQTSLSIIGMDNYTYYNKFINKQMEREYIKSNNIKTRELDAEEDPHSANCADISPYYSPEEIGNFKQTSPLVSESGKIKNKAKWINELTDLSSRLKYVTNSDKRKVIKEQIHSLGWNPEIPFDINVASKVSARYNINESNNGSDTLMNLAKLFI